MIPDFYGQYALHYENIRGRKCNIADAAYRIHYFTKISPDRKISLFQNTKKESVLHQIPLMFAYFRLSGFFFYPSFPICHISRT